MNKKPNAAPEILVSSINYVVVSCALLSTALSVRGNPLWILFMGAPAYTTGVYESKMEDIAQKSGRLLPF